MSGSKLELRSYFIDCYNYMNFIDSLPLDTIVKELFKQVDPHLEVLYLNSDMETYYNDLYFDSLWKSREHKRMPLSIATGNIGILCASDLLFKKSRAAIVDKDSMFILMQTVNYEWIYDYKMDKTNERLIKIKSKEIDFLYQHFFEWMSAVRKNGLDKMIAQNRGPLPTGFTVRKVRRYPISLYSIR